MTDDDKPTWEQTAEQLIALRDHAIATGKPIRAVWHSRGSRVVMVCLGRWDDVVRHACNQPKDHTGPCSCPCGAWGDPECRQ